MLLVPFFFVLENTKNTENTKMVFSVFSKTVLKNSFQKTGTK